MNVLELNGWNRLRHGGLLLDPQRLSGLAEHVPPPLPAFSERELRRFAGAILEDSADISEFVSFVLQKVCGFTPDTGTWQRGPQVGPEWSRRAITGEAIKPRQVWHGEKEGILPVFIDTEKRLGIGRGRRGTSQVVQWLRGSVERLALLTNGRQWRLFFAGLDFDAWAEWDVELWFEEGVLSPQVFALRTLISPMLWTPPDKDSPPPLLQAVLESRKGQAELSAILGERVREAVEVLMQAHGEVLKERCADVPPADIYQAAVRVVMRMVVILFAESRELLPRENVIYHGAHGLTGLLEELEKVAAWGGNRLGRSWNAWPRVLALFRLVYQGSHHTALPAPAYGGELFAPGDPVAGNNLEKVLSVFETACFEHELMSDKDVQRMLEHLTRTRVKLRQGRSSTWVPAPVDFSDLSSEYIGILYEGLLDIELKTAPSGDPVVFLSVGNQPALPLSRLAAMDDKAIENLLEKMKDTSRGEGTERECEAEEAVEEEASEDEGDEEEIETEIEKEDESDVSDERHTTRTRAETWARRAVVVGKLARKPKGAMTPEKRLIYEETIGRKARQLVTRVILPGEWYLVRWGGTRKGAGTFYTRPGLAVPTVHRTLRPLCYEELGARSEEREIRNEELGGGNEGFSRIDGMAAGHGVMRGNLPGGGQAAGTGTLRSCAANSEGGDKNHSNGVHFKQEARTKAIKAFVKDVLTPDLRRFLQGKTLFEEDLQEKASKVHEDALATISRLHNLAVHDSAERARIYREELIGSQAHRSLKTAMDFWCACWFWPANELEHAPLPSTRQILQKRPWRLRSMWRKRCGFSTGSWSSRTCLEGQGTMKKDRGTRNETLLHLDPRS